MDPTTIQQFISALLKGLSPAWPTIWAMALKQNYWYARWDFICAAIASALCILAIVLAVLGLKSKDDDGIVVGVVASFAAPFLLIAAVLLVSSGSYRISNPEIAAAHDIWNSIFAH